MNRLDKLIQELCPDGVPYKKLGEIATDIYRGSGIKREQVTSTGTPCVRYGEIYTTYGIWFDKCVSHTDASTVSSPKYFEYGDVLFVITGESVEDIAKSTAFVGHERCLAGGDIVVLKHEQNPKYLSYALATTNARKQKSSGKVKSKVVHSSVPAIKDIVIPVPHAVIPKYAIVSQSKAFCCPRVIVTIQLCSTLRCHASMSHHDVYAIGNTKMHSPGGNRTFIYVNIVSEIVGDTGCVCTANLTFLR